MSLRRVDLVLPPGFAEACGYCGSARRVALCWIPGLEELRWSDDGHAYFGTASAFKDLCRDPAAARALVPFHRANESGAVRPWLLIDRDTGHLSFGDPAEVWAELDQHG